jgi:hypothetical protein
MAERGGANDVDTDLQLFGVVTPRWEEVLSR